MTSLPSPPPAYPRSEQNVVIDFSDFQQSEAMSGVFSSSTLVEWVRSFPRTRSIHIYLPSGRRFGNARRLQSTLLGLGCIVTLRVPSLAQHTVTNVANISLAS